MNPEEFDHPDLTAYVMGELPPAEASRVRQMLARSPEARAEYERIQQMVGSLRQAPSVPKRSLNPRQRDTLLAMSQAIAGRKVIAFRPAPAAQPSFAWRFTKLAAAACVTVGAFVAGQKYANTPAFMLTSVQAKGASGQVDPSLTIGNDLHSGSKTDSFANDSSFTLENATVMDVVSIDTTPPLRSDAENALSEAKTAPETASPAQPEMLAKAPEATPAPAPNSPALAKAAPANANASHLAAMGRSTGFTSVASAPEAKMILQPKLLRRKPVEFAGMVLASPQSPSNKPKSGGNAGSQRKATQPPLLVHSWKSEVASCPWDSSRRIMRVVVQIPAEQAAVDYNEANYTLNAKFDPFHVLSYRLISEKHIPPTAGGTKGTLFAWYEIVPSRTSLPTTDRPVSIGSLEVVQPRGAAPVTPLRLQDRGLTWQESREDFAFETAMVGFGLLLRGVENVGALDHKMVVELAESNKGDDKKGERAKFIQSVKQAQRAAGF